MNWSAICSAGRCADVASSERAPTGPDTGLAEVAAPVEGSEAVGGDDAASVAIDRLGADRETTFDARGGLVVGCALSAPAVAAARASTPTSASAVRREASPSLRSSVVRRRTPCRAPTPGGTNDRVRGAAPIPFDTAMSGRVADDRLLPTEGSRSEGCSRRRTTADVRSDMGRVPTRCSVEPAPAVGIELLLDGDGGVPSATIVDGWTAESIGWFGAKGDAGASPSSPRDTAGC